MLRDSGPAANMCNDPAMLSTASPDRHEVVVLALSDVQAFEIGLASRTR